jgi:rifampicin phosphotransferase
MQYITLLENIQQYDRITVGGKAANLGKLINAGLPVPPGFLVLTSAYECFVAQNSLQPEIERLAQTISLTDPATAVQAALSIQELFKQGVLPREINEAVLSAYQQLAGTAVAVRSSATVEDLPGASFAGLQETFLNVLNPDDLLIALRRCWSSLLTTRALIYRARQHIPSQTVRMAVIVQQMVAATASGILFTCNPVTCVQNESVSAITFSRPTTGAKRTRRCATLRLETLHQHHCGTGHRGCAYEHYAIDMVKRDENKHATIGSDTSSSDRPG